MISSHPNGCVRKRFLMSLPSPLRTLRIRGLAEELVEGLLGQEFAAFADAVFVVGG